MKLLGQSWPRQLGGLAGLLLLVVGTSSACRPAARGSPGGSAGNDANQVPAVDSGTVAVNGTHLSYQEAGSGPAVVLISGGNLDLRMWDPQFLPLAHQHLVIRYDPRGYGKSGPADAPYQSHEHLYGLLRGLRVPRASLVGLSLGGRIAIDFALAHPEMVDRLVLASPGLSGWKFSRTDTAYFPDARRARDRGDAAALGLAWLKSAYMQPAMEHPELVARLREMAAANGKHWLEVLRHGDLERVAEPPALGRTASLGMPTLLVIGTRDVPDIQAIADTLTATMPHLRRVAFEGAGHMVNLEQAGRFTELVREFLRP